MADGSEGVLVRGGARWRWSLLSMSLGLVGCTPAPTPAAQPAAQAVDEPEPEAGVPPEPTSATVVHRCGQDPEAEQPIVDGALGEGDRVVRLLNKSGDDIQARLLGADLQPALPGTLHVGPSASGEFKVSAGDYFVRYRRGTNCEVRRGSRLELTGNHYGVEIAIKAQFDDGTRSNMRKVREPL